MNLRQLRASISGPIPNPTRSEVSSPPPGRAGWPGLLAWGVVAIALLAAAVPPAHAGSTTVSGGLVSYAREFAAANAAYVLPATGADHTFSVLRNTIQDFFVDVTLGNGATFTAGGLPAGANLTLTGGTGGAVTLTKILGGNDGDSKVTWFVDVTANFTGFPVFTLDATAWKIRDGGNVIRDGGTISLTISGRDAATGVPFDASANDTAPWLQGVAAVKTTLVPTTALLAARFGYKSFVVAAGDTDLQDNGATLEMTFAPGTRTPLGDPIFLDATDHVSLYFTGPLGGISALTWNPESGGFASSQTHFVTADDITAQAVEIQILGDVVRHLGTGGRGLRVTVDGTTVLTPRVLNLKVTIFMPRGGTTFTADLLPTSPLTTWTNDGAPVPNLISISPTSAAAGSAQLTLTLTGTNFIANSSVRWNGAARSTTFVGATQLQAVIPAGDLAVAGSFRVNVFNPAPLGGFSQVVNFDVNNPVPVLTSISPASAPVGGTPPVITLTGQSFTSASVARWNGASRPTTFVSSTQLTFQPTAADLALAGSVQVTVFTPAPGGGTSAAQTFSVTAGAPVLTVLAPSTTFAGAAAMTITLVGSSFTAQSVARWNGTDRPTTFVSGTILTAAIAAADLAAPGNASVTVSNPGVGESNALLFAVTAAGPKFEIQLSKSAYSGSESVVVTDFRLRNPSAASVPVEIKVWLEMPGTSPLSVLNLGADGSVVLPANLDVNLGPLTLFSAAAMPSGTYGLSSRTLDPASAALLNEDLNPFTIAGTTAPDALDAEPSAVDTPPQLLVTLSQSTYGDGGTVTATQAELRNDGPAASPEIKLWLRAPGAAATSVFSVGAQGELTLPSGTVVELGPLGVLPVVAATPRGEHELSSRIVNPVTGKFLSEDRNSFVVH